VPRARGVLAAAIIEFLTEEELDVNSHLALHGAATTTTTTDPFARKKGRQGGRKGGGGRQAARIDVD